jgi:hypothetical protein
MVREEHIMSQRSKDLAATKTAYSALIAEIAEGFTPGDLIGPGDMPDFTARQLQVIANHDSVFLSVALDDGGDAKLIDALEDQAGCYAALLDVLRHQAKASTAPDVQDELDRLVDGTEFGRGAAPEHGMAPRDFA